MFPPRSPMLSLTPQPRSTDGYVVHTSTIASTRPQDMKSPQLRSLAPVCILVPRGLNALAQPGQYNVLYNPLLLLCFVHSSDSREGKHFWWLRTTRQAAKCRHALNWLRFDSTSHSFPNPPPVVQTATRVYSGLPTDRLLLSTPLVEMPQKAEPG